ncbi:hypothetical protein NA57DRAFT_55065 [Rhizodiscina lignyota]|uniref:Uncharacterized protein n=1 Tax=Rhizodiscina lignyota TaxID=1504668 RepID=A0A9P4IMS8_9PEZI|nr:hypothetical protein NA57DRAFT_55065 [Rhizodiscina lignyota]
MVAVEPLAFQRLSLNLHRCTSLPESAVSISTTRALPARLADGGNSAARTVQREGGRRRKGADMPRTAPLSCSFINNHSHRALHSNVRGHRDDRGLIRLLKHPRPTLGRQKLERMGRKKLAQSWQALVARHADVLSGLSFPFSHESHPLETHCAENTGASQLRPHPDPLQTWKRGQQQRDLEAPPKTGYQTCLVK